MKITLTRFVRSGWLPLAVILLLPGSSSAQTVANVIPSWVSTWGTGDSTATNDPYFALEAYQSTNVFNNQTIRLIVHTSLGGEKVRVRLSNEFGATALNVGAVHVALSDAAERIVPGSDQMLTFNGQGNVTIPAGAPVVSDPLKFAVPALANLAISIYLPDAATFLSAAHPVSQQANYVAAPGSGDTTAAEALPLDTAAPTFQQWPLLTDVEVLTPNAGTFVAFGSSITTGIGSTADENRRWPDYLAKRLARAGLPLGVVNSSLVANRLLRDNDGPNAQARFDRDVLSRPGVRYVLVTDSAGVDIINGANNPAQNPSVNDLIGALKQLIVRAHSHGIKIFAGTLLPVEGFVETPDSRVKRLAVNDFLRSGVFDGVADFEKAILDPSDPFRILPTLDSGDHHHPNDAGYLRMAKTVVPLLVGVDAMADEGD